jgi:hypothetical protein
MCMPIDPLGLPWGASPSFDTADQRAADLRTDARTEQLRAEAEAQNLRREIKRVQAQLDGLMLANAAMWELMRDALKVDDAALAEKVQEIDLRDGVLDGKLAKPPRACLKCKRPLAPRHERCIYCGGEGKFV